MKKEKAKAAYENADYLIDLTLQELTITASGAKGLHWLFEMPPDILNKFYPKMVTSMHFSHSSFKSAADIAYKEGGRMPIGLPCMMQFSPEGGLVHTFISGCQFIFKNESVNDKRPVIDKLEKIITYEDLKDNTTLALTRENMLNFGFIYNKPDAIKIRNYYEEILPKAYLNNAYEIKDPEPNPDKLNVHCFKFSRKAASISAYITLPNGSNRKISLKGIKKHYNGAPVTGFTYKITEYLQEQTIHEMKPLSPEERQKLRETLKENGLNKLLNSSPEDIRKKQVNVKTIEYSKLTLQEMVADVYDTVGGLSIPGTNCLGFLDMNKDLIHILSPSSELIFKNVDVDRKETVMSKLETITFFKASTNDKVDMIAFHNIPSNVLNRKPHNVKYRSYYQDIIPKAYLNYAYQPLLIHNVELRGVKVHAYKLSRKAGSVSVYFTHYDQGNLEKNKKARFQLIPFVDQMTGRLATGLRMTITEYLPQLHKSARKAFPRNKKDMPFNSTEHRGRIKKTQGVRSSSLPPEEVGISLQNEDNDFYKESFRKL